MTDAPEVKVDQKRMARNQAYQTRGVVAKFHKIGEYQQSIMLRVPIYKFLTLDAGNETEAIPVVFVQQAPVERDEFTNEVYVDLESIPEGYYVVSPGLLYQRCQWFPNLTAEHMKALQTYKRKSIIEAHKDDAPAIDLGTLDATSDQVTKQ
jgi:hypothetical protein